MNKIKVLTIGNSNDVPGGITTVISQILSFDWERTEFEMRFIPKYKGGNNVIKVVYFTFAYFRILFSILKKEVDIAHIHMSYKGSFSRTNLLVKLFYKFKIPIIVHLHGSEFREWYNSLSERRQMSIKKMISRTNKFIVLGEKWESFIKEIAPSARVAILPNSVSCRNENATWNSSPFTIIFLGVLIKRKGLFDLLSAFSVALEKSLVPLKLIIAGDGEEYSALNQVVKNKGLSEFIKFSGWISSDEKFRLLKKSQVLILPSYNEGLPMSILEAMSFGLPIISSDVGSIDEVVIHNENGFLTSPGNIEMLSEYIVSISSDRERWENMSKSAKILSHSKFSEKAYFDKLIMIYREIM